jgi:hypothetical protein
MEQDLIEAKAYLSQQGYGTGTNYTTNLVTVLLANYAEMQLKKLRVADVIKNEVAVCCHENIEVILPVRRCLKCQQIKEWTPKQTVL